MLESDEALQAQSFPCSLKAKRLIQLPPSRGPSGACSLCTHCRPGGGGGGDVVSLATRLGQAWVLAADGSQCCLRLGPGPPLASKSPHQEGPLRICPMTDIQFPLFSPETRPRELWGVTRRWGRGASCLGPIPPVP